MNKTLKEISDDEITQLINTISGPTYRYMIKRISSCILTNDKHAEMTLNSFINAVIISLSSLDVNMIKWIEKFYELRTGEKLEVDKLRFSLMNNLNKQLDIKIH